MLGERSSTIRLADGRELGYAEWGTSASDTVVVDLHGGPGCRLDVSGDSATIADTDVRWVTVDRPGLGMSWPRPGRRVVDFVSDLAELLEMLEIDRFHVVGTSMGGAYAAAAASVLPDRVLSATLFAPVPVDLAEPGGAERMGKAVGWLLARDEPWQLCQFFTALGLEARRNPALAFEMFTGGAGALSESEMAAVERFGLRNRFVASMIEATRQGASGIVEDMRVELESWGFNPRSISVPMSLWQSDDDSFIPAGAIDGWSAMLPQLRVRRLLGEGHLFAHEHTGEFLSTLSPSSTR